MSFLPSICPGDAFIKERLSSFEYADSLDKEDMLSDMRNSFWIPKAGNEGSERDCIYLCGNSLGLQPKSTENLIAEELQVWKTKGVEGHFDHKFGRPWVSIDEHCLDPLAKIVGAHPQEIAVMGSLTNNLHLLMASFYRPCRERYKILMEPHAFPSDKFAIESQIRNHGFDPSDALLVAKSNQDCIVDMSDIEKIIREEGSKLALVLIGYR